MPTPVCGGAKMSCSCGQGESALYVREKGAGSSREQSLATVDDYLPMVNIPPFFACTAAANPQAANPSGQKPCTPRFSAPWSEEVEFVTLHGQALLEQRATLACDYGGTIRLLDAAQQTVAMDDSMLKGAVGAMARAAMRPTPAGGMGMGMGTGMGTGTGTGMGMGMGSGTGTGTGMGTGGTE